MTADNSRADALTITEDARDGNWYEFTVNGHHGLIRVVARMEDDNVDYPLGKKVRDFLLAASPVEQPAAAPIDVLHTLRAAKQFIANGIELGFIRMPDSDCPDPAHEVPKLIDAAIASFDNSMIPRPDLECAHDYVRSDGVCTECGSLPAPSPADERAATPAAQWRVDGETDPHAGRYDVERAALTLGMLTDDELANGAFMNYDRPLDVSRAIARDPEYHAPIVWMTAVKDRIRWLSRALERARASSANETGVEGAHALAHEVWSAAQRAPGEGIEDAVQRIAAILSRSHTAAAEAVAIPAGCALVPIEPTPQMRKAAADAWLDCGSKLILNKAAAAARAAIAAAPSSKGGS